VVVMVPSFRHLGVMGVLLVVVGFEGVQVVLEIHQ